MDVVVDGLAGIVQFLVPLDDERRAGWDSGCIGEVDYQRATIAVEAAAGEHFYGTGILEVGARGDVKRQAKRVPRAVAIELAPFERDALH